MRAVDDQNIQYAAQRELPVSTAVLYRSLRFHTNISTPHPIFLIRNALAIAADHQNKKVLRLHESVHFDSESSFSMSRQSIHWIFHGTHR